MMDFKIVVFIGGGYVFKNDDSIGVVLYDTNSMFVPLSTIKEFNNIHNLGNLIADLFDYYNKSIDKNVYSRFAVKIHLNTKSNIRVYYGKQAIDAIDWISNNYSPSLREFM